MFWLDRAYGWLAAVYVVLALLGIGEAGLRRLRIRVPEGPTRVTLGFVAGAALAVPILIVTSLFGGLRTPHAIGLGLVSLPFALRVLPALRGLRLTKLSLLAGIVVAAPYLIQTLLPEHDWDGPSYHVPTALMFQESGAWATDYYRAQVNFPGGVHLIYAWLLAIGAESALVPLNLLASALALLAGSALARDLFGAGAAKWAFAIAATNHALLELGLDTRIDNFLTLWIVAAVHAFMLWSDRERDQGRLLVLVGAALGLGLATKYSAAIYVLVVAPLALYWIVKERRTGSAIVFLAMLAGALPSAFWYVRNLVELRDPVYPFRGDRIYTTKDGKVEAYGPALEALIRKVGPPPADFMQPFPRPALLRTNLVDFVEILMDPDSFENKQLHFVSPFAPIVFLLVLTGRRRGPRMLVLIVALSWIALALGPPTSRYMLPTFTLAAVGAAGVFASLPTRALRVGLAVLVACAIVRQTVQELRNITFQEPLERVARALQWERHPTPQEWMWIQRLEPQRYLSGREDEIGFLSRVGYNRAIVSPVIAAFVRDELANGRMKPGEKIFAIGEDKQGCIGLPLLADMSRECFRWLVELVRHGGDHDQVHKSLWDSGVRWILYNLDYVEWCRRNVAWTENDDRLRKRDFLFSHWQLLRFLQGRTESAFEWPGNARVFRLVPPK